MIVCPNCEHHNPEGAGNCAACGASLKGFVYRVCGACGALSPAQNTFCHRCLAALVPEVAEPGVSAADTIAPFAPSEPLPPEAMAPAPSARRPVPSASDESAPAGSAPDAPQQGAQAEEAEATQPDETLTIEQAIAAAARAESEEAADVETSAPQPTDTATSWVTRDAESTVTSTVADAHDLADLSAPLPRSLTDDLVHPQDLLPLEAAVSLPHRAAAPAFARPGETEQFDAELFHSIATEPASLAESTHVVLPRQTRLLPAIGRALLYLLVLLAALSPWLGDSEATGALAVSDDAQAVRMASAVRELPARAHILLAIDYEPSYAGELDPLAQAVLRQLGLQEANLLVMSTKPTGMALAQGLFSALADEVEAYGAYGERYVLAGYLPGNEAALRTLSGSIDGAFKQDFVLGQPLNQHVATQQLTTLTELDAVVVVSDDGQVVRRWIEQVHSRTQVPMYALVSARIKPMLLPYVGSGQLTALLGGPSDAAEYGVASEGPQWSLPRSRAYLAYLGVLVLVAIVTNVAHLARKRVKRT